jgi:hypothetical protein
MSPDIPEIRAKTSRALRPGLLGRGGGGAYQHSTGVSERALCGGDSLYCIYVYRIRLVPSIRMDFRQDDVLVTNTHS